MNEQEQRRLIEELEAEWDMQMYSGFPRKNRNWILKELFFAVLGMMGLASVLWMVWEHYYG